jgi:acyl carrier protein
MNDDEVLVSLREALRSAAPEVKASLTMDSTLADLGIDSIAALEMAGHLENKLSIHFPDDELAQINSIRDFVVLVRRSVPGASP